MPIKHVFSSPIADWRSASNDPSPVTIYNSTNGSYTTAVSALIEPGDWNDNHVISLSASDINNIFAAEHRVTMTTGVGGITFGLDNEIGFFEPFVNGGQAMTMGLGTWYFNPIQIPGALNSGELARLFSFGTGISSFFAYPASTLSTQSSGTCQKYATLYNRAALYLRGTGASTTRLERQWSGENIMVMSQEFWATNSGVGSTALGMSETLYASYITGYGNSGESTPAVTTQFTTQFTSGTTSLALSRITTLAGRTAFQMQFHNTSSGTGGPIIMPLGLDYRVSAGEWFIAHQVSMSTSLTSNTTNAYTIGSIANMPSLVGVTEPVNTLYKPLGATVTAVSSNIMPGFGFYNTASNTAPQYVNLNTTGGEIRQGNTNLRAYFNYQKF